MKIIKPKTALIVGGTAFVVASSSLGAWAVTSAGKPTVEQPKASRKPASTVNSNTQADVASKEKGAVASTSKDLLKAGQTLKPGQRLTSRNGKYRLLQQKDGNLILSKGTEVIWSSGTAPHSGAYTEMRADGNLVIAGKSKEVIWSSNTAGNKGAYLAVQDDGNLVIYSKTKKALWGRNLYVSFLPPNMQLKPGQGIRSENGQYYLGQQGDGNLVLFKGAFDGPKTPLWSSATAPHSGAYTAMQGDGNLVVLSKDGEPLWHAGTAPSKGAFLAVQNDGNLVVYSATKKVLWWRNMYNVQLPSGYLLKAGQAVYSHNRKYFLIQQSDGNLVLCRGEMDGPHTVLWSSATAPHPGAYTAMQGDGNLVVLSKGGEPLWHAGTAPSKGAYLMVQDDGNMIVYSAAEKPLWSSSTAGK
jgi:hypothetical protein